MLGVHCVCCVPSNRSALHITPLVCFPRVCLCVRYEPRVLFPFIFPVQDSERKSDRDNGNVVADDDEDDDDDDDDNTSASGRAVLDALAHCISSNIFREGEGEGGTCPIGESITSKP